MGFFVMMIGTVLVFTLPSNFWMLGFVIEVLGFMMMLDDC